MQLHENLVVADRFKLVRMIGRGGMGSVWQAVHLALDQPCAVKFIEGEAANNADAHARFEREAKAAAQLRSPHVVQIIDHGLWQGAPYIAMELLEGEDLGKVLAKAGGRLPPARLVQIVEQVCRGLTKAHAAGIVHRDLKPDNIFLVQDDDREVVKILDFGVAKQTSQFDGSNTKTGALLGTPYFMSPEQARGIKSVDSRSDLWSLAVIVYLALTGRRPFDSDALGDLLVKIIVSPVPVPSQVAPVPPGFDAWWARATARAPEHRFQTAKELASSLAAALGVAVDPGITANMQPAPAALPAQYATPQPYPQQTALLHTPQPAQPTPPSFASSPAIDPAFGSANARLGGTGNPATFAGVEPPAMPPKKSAAPAVAVVLGAVVLVGLVGGGVFVSRRHGAGAAPAPTTSAVVAEPATASAEPSAIAAPSGTAATSDSAAAASATASAPSSSTAAAPTHAKSVPKASATATIARPTTTATTTATAAPTATTTATSRKPSMGDDRKW